PHDRQRHAHSLARRDLGDVNQHRKRNDGPAAPEDPKRETNQHRQCQRHHASESTIERMNLMQGKVVVLTGGTSGIGEATALKLAGMGARLVLVARDPQRIEATLQRLPLGVKHTAHFADLSRLAETKRVAQEIAAAEPHIDVLINNAGVMSAHRQLTADGLELTFATNHLAYFVLTQALLPNLLASAPARIINTASEVHRGARLDFNDLQSEKSYSSYGAYGKSKLANVLFTRELAK